MGKKRRILFTIPNFKTAGSQYVLLSIIRSLDANKYNIYVGVEKFPECIPEDIPKNKRLLIDQKGRLIDDLRSFRNILKSNKIDVVHSWDYKSNYSEALACRLTGVPYVFTKKNNAWSKRWLLKSILAKHIAYDNPKMKTRFYKSWYFKHKITYIPHGVNLKQFKPTPKMQHAGFDLCCAGNINANKNQKFLLEALIDLPEKVNVHLYGNEDVNYKEQLNAFIETQNLENRVYFHGYVNNEELPNRYKMHDVFVLPSFNEGFPVCLLEAMACGLPVLSSNSGGGAAHMLQQTKGGEVFNLESTQELIDIIKKLMSQKDIYEKYANNAAENVKIHFSVEREIEAYNSLYLRLNENNQ